MKPLFVILQYIVPHHALSRLVGRLANCRLAWVKLPFIRWFITRYRVDMGEAEVRDPAAFGSFNEFFTRALQPGARPLDDSPASLACPADGAVSELGTIQGDRLLQAKGRHFSTVALLGGDAQDARQFHDGSFITIYLSPRDYHRVHMPVSGTLLKTVYVPGRLFSVNQVTADHVPELFARNERLACFFDTPAGPMALVMVGAMIVAGIETVWAGKACPNHHGLLRADFTGQATNIRLPRGGEMGRFMLGSTVILLFGPGAVRLNDDLCNGRGVRMGESIGTLLGRN